jgi:3-methyladenine DNA glycosylase/8-oxoguanine DNA glycosylase
MPGVQLEDLQPLAPDQAIAGVKARLRLPDGVEFKGQLESLRASGANDVLDTFGQTDGLDWLERPVMLGERPFLLRLASLPPEQAAVELHLLADDHSGDLPGEEDIRQAAEFAGRRFWWDLDMAAVHRTLSVNDYGRDLLARYWPMRPANLAGPWEGLLRTVISNQIFPGLAVRLQRALLEFYSDSSATFLGKPYKFYPSVERVADIFPDDLLGLRFSRQKAKYIPGLAQMLLDQPERYNWERLKALPGAEAVAVLDELPGVGPWTAHYVAMRGLPHADIFVDEAGLRKVIAVGFDRPPDISSEEAAKLAAPFAPFRSLACYYSYMKMYHV